MSHSPLDVPTLQGHITQWMSAVELQRKRLVDAGSGMDLRTDSHLFAIALRNLLRAAELGRPLNPGKIGRLIQNFRSAVPVAVNLRDVVEHFDAYATGRGKFQKQKNLPPGYPVVPDEGRRRPRGMKLRAPPGSFGMWAVHHGTNVVVGAGEFEIDVEVATRAAHDLAEGLLSVLPGG